MPFRDDREATGAVYVRVGILAGRPPVGGPPGVGHAHRALGAYLMQHRFETIEVPHRMEQLKPALVDDRDARRVIPAVLQPSQASEQDVPAWSTANIPDDPAHGPSPSSVMAAAGDRGRIQHAGRSSGPTIRALSQRPLHHRDQAFGDLPAADSVGASTITRTNGSVPEGAALSAPRRRGLLLPPHGRPDLGSRLNRSLRDARTFTRSCGKRRIMPASSSSGRPQ